MTVYDQLQTAAYTALGLDVSLTAFLVASAAAWGAVSGEALPDEVLEFLGRIDEAAA